MAGSFPDRGVEEMQWGVSTLLFIPAVFLFFFLIGLYRTLNSDRRLGRALPVVVGLAYGYASLLTLVPLLGRSFSYLSVWMQILVVLVPLAAFQGYRAGRASAGWVDSGWAWRFSLLILLFLSGTWLVRLLAYSPQPGFGMFEEPPVLRLHTRAGSFVINRLSLFDQELRGALFDTAFAGVTFLMLLVLLSGLCLLVRARNRALGLQIALVAQPVLLQRWAPEASLCLMACLALGFGIDRHLPRESGRASPLGRLAVTIALFLTSVLLSNLVVWKFVALSFRDQWDVVCIAYGGAGLIIGRCVALWGPTAPPLRRSLFSIDEAIIRLQGLRPTWPSAAFRFDTVMVLLPYLVLGVVAFAASLVRGVRLPLAGLIAVLTLAAALGLVLAALQLHCWRKTLRCVPVSRDRMAMMRLFSASACRASSMNAYEFLALVLLPIVVPAAVCLAVGIDTLSGLITTGMTLAAAVVVSRLALAADRSRPPAVLVLGTSAPPAIRLQGSVSRAVWPLRAVSLLAFDHQHPSEVLPPRRDCLRTIWQQDWFEIVKGLIELAPFLVIDGRNASPATVQELEELERHGHLSRTILVSSGDADIPLLQWWQQNRGTALPTSLFFAVVDEHKVGEVVRAALLRPRARGAPLPPLTVSPFSDSTGNRSAGPAAVVFEAVGDRVRALAALLHTCLAVLLSISILLAPFLVVVGLCTGIIPLPKSWGPAPWSQQSRQARESAEKIDPALTPEPESRVELVREVFEVQELQSVARAQEKALQDPDERVQIEALNGLMRCLRDNPSLLVGKNVFGWRVQHYVRLDLIQKMGANRSAKVRIAVVDFWRNTTEFSATRARHLREMLAVERDPEVRKRIEQAIEAIEPAS